MAESVIKSAIISKIRYIFRYSNSFENQVRPLAYISLSTLRALRISPNILNCCSRVLACGITSLIYS